MQNSQEVEISEIKFNPENPRVITDDKFRKLVQSIKEFPQMLFIRPIVVNGDMMVLGGKVTGFAVSLGKKHSVYTEFQNIIFRQKRIVFFTGREMILTKAGKK